MDYEAKARAFLAKQNEVCRERQNACAQPLYECPCRPKIAELAALLAEVAGEAEARGRLTENEARVIDHIVDAWNEFVSLPVEHPDEITEFRQAIHAAQTLILSRPTRRAMAAPKPKDPK